MSRSTTCAVEFAHGPESLVRAHSAPRRESGAGLGNAAVAPHVADGSSMMATTAFFFFRCVIRNISRSLRVLLGGFVGVDDSEEPKLRSFSNAGTESVMSLAGWTLSTLAEVCRSVALLAIVSGGGWRYSQATRSSAKAWPRAIRHGIVEGADMEVDFARPALAFVGEGEPQVEQSHDERWARRISARDGLC